MTQDPSATKNISTRQHSQLMSITDSMTLSYFPPQSVGTLTKNWAIHDPAGRTTSELAKLGFSAPSVAVGADLSGVDVLVVGSLIDATSRLPATAAHIEAGLRVVIFEQSAEALEAMGFRTEDRVPRHAFPGDSDHPILAGVEPSDLVNWRGSGDLVPAIKRNEYPWPDMQMHWGNRGSVASVIPEIPHHGAFTPVLLTAFDLAYGALLEWRHGAGSVVFSQLDVNGRVGLEPAAGLLVTSIISYLDGATLAGPDATRGLAYVGSDEAERQLLDQIGFVLRAADADNLSLELGEIVVIGRGASASLTDASRQSLDAHVTSGGAVVFLPRTSAELGSATWPYAITTTPVNSARVVRPLDEAVPALVRAIGPELTHWRTYVDLDLIAEGGLPEGADRYLDGLVGVLADGAGQWVISQFDWRALDAGSPNTLRPRWNARKFYRQLFTNLGAKSSPTVASGIAPAEHRAPMVTLGPWRAAVGAVLTGATGDAKGGYQHVRPPGIDTLFALDPWPTAVGPTWGKVFEPDADGYVDLRSLDPRTGTPTENDPTGPPAGLSAYARAHVYTTTTRNTTFSISTGYWGLFKVDGTVLLDDSQQGQTKLTNGIDLPRRVGIELEPGWHTLEVVVVTSDRAGGHYGDQFRPRHLGFSVQVEDPGDLSFDAGASAPVLPPSTDAASRSTAPIDWYMEPKPRGEDVYRGVFY